MINLIKLSVGSESVEGLAAWQETQRQGQTDGLPRHVTRMWPKREAEIVGQGSIYWVIKGQIQCRQLILRFDEIIGEDGIRRCAIVLEPKIIQTSPAPRRAFQGWRYLTMTDAPPDLNKHDSPLPQNLAEALSRIGVI